MATELQKQVAAFKKKNVQVQSLQRGLPSIFLNAREAAAVDTSAVYEAGCKGLRDLTSYDERFAAFEGSLFHPTSVNVQRELKTKEENSSIDLEINSLLSLLSLWPTQPSAHLVLEYLVRRYRVHDFNTDALLQAFLIAHDHKIFAKIVQLCRLEDTPWIFLAGVRDSGSPPPRSLFVQQAIKSAWILDIICSVTTRTLSLLGLKKTSAGANIASLEMDTGFRAVAFATALIVEVANKVVFREDMLRNVCLFVVEGLKCKIRSHHSTLQKKLLVDWKVSSCVIVSQLSVKTQFGESIIKAFSKGLAAAISMISGQDEYDSLLETLMTTVAILSQSAQLLVDHRILSALLPVDREDWLYAHIDSAPAGKYTRLLNALGAGLLHAVTKSSSEDEDDDEEGASSRASMARHIPQFFKRNWIGAEDSAVTLRQLLNGSTLSSQRSHIDTIIRNVSDFQPFVFNTVVRQVLASADEADVKTINDRLSEVFQNFGNNSSMAVDGSSVFLNLSSSIKELRVHALNSLIEVGDSAQSGEVTANQTGIAQALVQCLEETDYDIVILAWKDTLLKKVQDSLGVATLFRSMQLCWQHWSIESLRGSKSALNILNQILCSITEEVASLLSSNEVFRAWVIASAGSVVSLYQEKEGKTATKLVEQASKALRHVFLSSSAEKKSKASKKSTEKKSENIVLDLAHLLAQNATNSVLLEAIVTASSNATDDFSIKGTASFVVKLLLQAKTIDGDNATLVADVLSRVLAPLMFTFINNGAGLQSAQNAISGYASLLVPALVSSATSVSASFEEALTASLATLSSKDTISASFLQLLTSSGIAGECLHTTLQSTSSVDLLAVLPRYLQCGVDSSFPIEEVSVRTVAMCSIQALLSSGSTDSASNLLLILTHLLFQAKAEQSVQRNLALRCITAFSSITEKLPKNISINSECVLKAADVKAFVSFLLERRDLISNDSDAVVAVASDALANGSDSVAAFILLAASIVSAQNHGYSAFLVSTLPSTSLRQHWKVVMKYLKAATNEADAGFVEVLVATVAKNLLALTADQQQDFIAWISDCLSSSRSLEALLPRRLLSVIIPVLPFHALPKAAVEKLLQSLFQLQSSKVGNKDVVQAILALDADPVMSMSILQDAIATTEEFEALLRVRKNSIVDEDDEEKDFSDDGKADDVRGYESKGVSISAKLQSMVSLAEVVVPIIVRKQDSMSSLGMSLLSILLQLLDRLCQPGCVSIISLEFFKTIVVELIYQTLNKVAEFGLLVDVLQMGDDAITKTPAKSKGKKKAETTANTSATGLSSEKATLAIRNIMHCLSTVRAANIHTSALGVLKLLLSVRKDALRATIASLGEFLSHASESGTHLLIKGRLLVNLVGLILPSADAESTDSSVLLATRDVVYHIFRHIVNMPVGHRWALLKSMAKLEGNKELVALLIVQTLLVHTLVKYESKVLEQKHVAVDSISLSRAAQRRAKRVMQNSDSEEFFTLAQSFLLEQPSSLIIKVVIQLLEMSRQCTLYSVGEAAPKEEGADDFMVLDIERFMGHFSELRSTVLGEANGISANSKSDWAGNAATIAILQMEFINEVLLQPQFHRQLATDLLANRVSQHDMMEVAESSLEICVESDALRQSRQRGHGNTTIEVRLENETHRLSVKAVAEIYADMSLQMLSNLQALLDGPSFLTVIQELLDHDVAAIRQRAIVFLKDRLQSLLSEKRMSELEHGLYLDLAGRLREIIKTNLSALLKDKTQAASEDAVVSLPYAQSALLAIDVLVMKLGRTPQWQAVIMEVFHDYLGYFDSVYPLISFKSKSGHYLQKALESRKFLGSLILSCASLCAALQAAALPVFPQLMDKMMSVLQAEVALWRDESTRTTVLESDRRAHVLFLRSLISALSIVLSSLPKFGHPYLKTITPLLLEVMTSVQQASDTVDLSGLKDDANACLEVISSELPPRLSLPALCATLPDCIQHGGDAIHRFAMLLIAIVSKSDRTTSLNNMNVLLTATLDLLSALQHTTNGLVEYSFEEVQSAVAECVVELSLKLTENELKTFVTRVVDWKTSSSSSSKMDDDEAGDEENTENSQEDKCYRQVHFYATIGALLNRFQSLFFSSIALIWTDMMSDLDRASKSIKKLLDTARKAEEDKGGKKRKRTADVYVLLSDNDQTVVDLTLTSVANVMSIGRALCTITGATFIDEKRYETFYQRALPFLSMRSAFEGDDEYLSFARESVSSTLCELCVSINRDLLWKPLNHQILLQTRHAAPVVRIVAVDLLHDLFDKVGADYLAVLPECLSYISELLEDDNAEVVKHTRQAIEVIEELSGEPLDSFLQ